VPRDDQRPPTPAAALAEVIEQRQVKNLELAAKQARLLAVLAAGAAPADDRPETEADGPRAGELRRLKAQRLSDSLRHKARGGQNGRQGEGE
jgi:hypothetical protein